MTDPKKSNPNAISVRMKGANYARTAFQRRHDMRIGQQPDYVDRERTSLNSVLVESQEAGELKKLCESRRDPKLRKMASNSSVSVSGIITFGSAIQAAVSDLSTPRQEKALRAVSAAVSERLGADLTGLVVHRDESALHAHFQMPAIRADGKPLSKIMTPTVMSEIQDIAFQAMMPFAPVERGQKKRKRIEAGAKPSDTINRSVKQLHEDLPTEIEGKQRELAAIEDKIRKHGERLAKLREIEELTEKERKRLEAYQRRADDAQARFDALTDEIERLKEVKAQVQNSVEFTPNGQQQFERAMELQAGAMDEALKFNPETPEIVTDNFKKAAFQDGEPRRFSKDEQQNNFVHAFLHHSFQAVSNFFTKLKNSIALAEYARTVPEPLQQLQNHIDSLRDAVTETLTQLGIADQRPDVGVYIENGDPPPVLELVFSRAEQKAKRLNQALANSHSMSGPSM